jgi:opacity protein-like surface antigen
MKLAVGVTLLLLATSALAADQYTRGYTRQDGTYVQPHYSTPDNQYRSDNYSARGNMNPYTGERGSQRHEFTNPPAYNRGYGLDSGSSRRR